MDGIQRLFSGMQAAATGLSAERVRMDVIAKNIANAQTTRMPGGGAYRRQQVLFEPILERADGERREVLGVRVSEVVEDFDTPMELIHWPGHPDADEQGMVQLPNVNALREMADLVTAMRAYEANLSIQESFVRMAERALRAAQG